MIVLGVGDIFYSLKKCDDSKGLRKWLRGIFIARFLIPATTVATNMITSNANAVAAHTTNVTSTPNNTSINKALTTFTFAILVSVNKYLNITSRNTAVT